MKNFNPFTSAIGLAMTLVPALAVADKLPFDEIQEAKIDIDLDKSYGFLGPDQRLHMIECQLGAKPNPKSKVIESSLSRLDPVTVLVPGQQIAVTRKKGSDLTKIFECTINGIDQKTPNSIYAAAEVRQTGNCWITRGSHYSPGGRVRGFQRPMHPHTTVWNGPSRGHRFTGENQKGDAVSYLLKLLQGGNCFDSVAKNNPGDTIVPPSARQPEPGKYQAMPRSALFAAAKLGIGTCDLQVNDAYIEGDRFTDRPVSSGNPANVRIYNLYFGHNREQVFSLRSDLLGGPMDVAKNIESTESRLESELRSYIDFGICNF